MFWALILFFAFGGAAGAQTPAPGNQVPGAHTSPIFSQPTPKLLSAALPFSTEDSAAESELLELANQRRRQAGVAPLRADDSLTEAARIHARLMVERQQLAHQFNGEPSLMSRLRDSGLRLDSAGENVAYHASVEKAFEALMQSPPHRQNLLDPQFNVAGMAAYWSGGRLYVVQDFAHRLPEMMPTSKRLR